MAVALVHGPHVAKCQDRRHLRDRYVTVEERVLVGKGARYVWRVRGMPVTPSKSTGALLPDTSGSSQATPDVVRLQITETPLSPDSPLNSVTGKDMHAIEDEQTVSMALISLLAATTIHDTHVSGDWSLDRKAFFVSTKEATGLEKRIYEARVDGVFRTPSKEVKAIAEVKPYLRHSKINAIRMQETAQMAAWICTYPPGDLDVLRKNNKVTRYVNG